MELVDHMSKLFGTQAATLEPATEPEQTVGETPAPMFTGMYAGAVLLAPEPGRSYREFDNDAHAEMAKLLVDSGNQAVCVEHFTNEGYDPFVINAKLATLMHQASMVASTIPLPTGDVAPRNPSCPEPFFGAGFYETPAGAKVLFELRDPHVVLFDNFLSEAECDHLVEFVNNRFDRSRVVVPDGIDISEDRSSQTAHTVIGETETIKQIEARISQTVHWPTLSAESLQIIRYQVGEEYKPHYDFFHPTDNELNLASPKLQRTATLILYLEEPTMGGATFFPTLGLRVPARKGQALFFSYPKPGPGHTTLHSGEPVIEGTKTIATKWFKTLEYGQ